MVLQSHYNYLIKEKLFENKRFQAKTDNKTTKNLNIFSKSVFSYCL